jgi:hypothetical protein
MHPPRRPNPDPSPEALEARLRALPPLPAPADLEARLLANIPLTMPARKKSWAVRTVLVGTLAAACLLVVLTLSNRGGMTPPVPPDKTESVRKDSPRSEDDSGSLAAINARRNLEDEDKATFDWPLSEATPLRAAVLPPDLFD